MNEAETLTRRNLFRAAGAAGLDLKPFTPGEEGLQDHRLMEAIYRSAAEGRPMTLPRIETLDTFRGAPPAEG